MNRRDRFRKLYVRRGPAGSLQSFVAPSLPAGRREAGREGVRGNEGLHRRRGLRRGVLRRGGRRGLVLGGGLAGRLGGGHVLAFLRNVERLLLVPGQAGDGG